MTKNILNICLIHSILEPKDLSVLSSIAKLNTDDKKILKKSEDKWFEWKIKNMINAFENLKQQFYAISMQLLYPIQVTEELEDEQEFIIHQKKKILYKIEVIIRELLVYPKLLQYPIKKFMSEILDFLRSQLYHDILFKQPYSHLINEDFQLNHELLEMFIKILSNIDFSKEVKQIFQEQLLQLLDEKTEQLYNNIALFSLDCKKKFRMQITELDLLVRHQMQPLDKQNDFFQCQLKLTNDVIEKTFHFYDLLNDFHIDMIRNYEEDLKKSQLKLLCSLVLPWSVNWIMNSYRNFDVYDLEYILSDYYLEERVEILHKLIN